eukprot:TRINITY_DN17342_c0_g1_i1.p1 TRINITY_DN17342_c0_g1~~TRINITY_DN17342_c0_g1_i1.p1  ORF type:complete len:298 (+),score=37.82 TRINITY_DN17342_c0_g1_i1:234-1127(+)
MFIEILVAKTGGVWVRHCWILTYFDDLTTQIKTKNLLLDLYFFAKQLLTIHYQFQESKPRSYSSQTTNLVLLKNKFYKKSCNQFCKKSQTSFLSVQNIIFKYNLGTSQRIESKIVLMAIDVEQVAHNYAGCVKENLGFIYLKAQDFNRLARVAYLCGINLSEALRGCVVCALANEEFASLQFVGMVDVVDDENFIVISEDVSVVHLLNVELHDSLIQNFKYRQIQNFSRRATKSEVFQTVQRIIKLDTFDQFGDYQNKNDVKWLVENLFEYDLEMEFEFGNNGKLTEDDILGVEAEQ